MEPPRQTPARKERASVATLDGTRTEIPEEALDLLKLQFRGEILTPSDSSYAGARGPFNAMHPDNPSLVFRCSGTADVVDAVNFAR